MNGGLIVGTMDGANIEIREECGHDTMFIFGCQEHEVTGIAAKAQEGHYPIDQRLQDRQHSRWPMVGPQAEPEAQEEFESIISRLCNTRAAGRRSMGPPLMAEEQAKVDETYKNIPLWCKLSIQAAASMAYLGKVADGSALPLSMAMVVPGGT
eukprot:Skav213309  [mRNA]  locus=scaffold1383:38444:42535:+ [translate_table: standard]